MAAYKSQSRVINEYYQKGISALEKKNYDYAIEMLLQVVLEEPLFADARRELHRAEREKFQEHPHSLFSLIFTRLNNFIPFLLALYHDSRKHNEKAIAFYEDLLKSEPQNKLLLRKIAHLALKNQWVDVAIIAFESLAEIHSDNAALAKQLGDLYRDKQDVEKASYYFKKSLEIKPHDQQVSKALKDLEALRTIQRGKWEESGSYRGKIKDEKVAHDLEMESKKSQIDSVAGDKIALLKKAIQENPDEATVWIELIDFYLRVERFEELEPLIAQAQTKFPQSEQLTGRVFQFKKKQLRRDIDRIDTALTAEPSNTELIAQKNKLSGELNEYERTILENKVALYPNDLSLKYELGDAYFQIGSFDKSIAEFQQAVKDPALAVKALNKLGLSFYHKGMYDLAILQFNKALGKIPSINAASKEIIYNLGTTLEVTGKIEEAMEAYKKIYEVDISYRDVSQKIENFYKKG